jgi:Leucine-rich repeat (LRR) protein
MKKNIKSDFKFLEIPDKNILTIQSSRIKECMDYLENNEFDGIHIDPFFGFDLTNLDFLRDYPNVVKRIKSISIDEEIKDISSLILLTELKYLLIGRKDPKIDFSYFSKLEELNISGGNYICNLESCKNLRSLTLFYFNPKCKGFSELPAVNWVKELNIINSGIISMNGLEKFKNLQKISFEYCAKLENLCCLDSSVSTLVNLVFLNCKKIVNHDYVEGLKNLEVLALNYCGSIKSLSFLDNIPSLKHFRFVGTDVLDGNLFPVLRLDYASFSNKRHFSHSMEEVKSLYEERTGKKRII